MASGQVGTLCPAHTDRFFVVDKKNRSENRFVCADFCSDIKSLRSFLGVAYNKKSVVCADSVREKIGPSLRLFLGAPYDKKSVRVRWALPCKCSRFDYSLISCELPWFITNNLIDRDKELLNYFNATNSENWCLMIKCNEEIFEVLS